MYDQIYFISMIMFPAAIVVGAAAIYAASRVNAFNRRGKQFEFDAMAADAVIADSTRVVAVRNQLLLAAMNPGHRTMADAVAEEWDAMQLDEDTAISVVALASTDTLPGFKQAVEKAYAAC